MSNSTPPRIVVTGMYRSGSTRLFNVIREPLLRRYPLARAAHYGRIELLEQALVHPAPGVFKEHVLSEAVIEEVYSGRIQAVATVREPVAAMVSLCSTFDLSANDAANITDETLKSLERISEVAKIYTYETATDYRPTVIRGLLSDLGLTTNWAEALSLSYRWGRRNARRHSDTLLRKSERTHDPVTLFHPGHIGPARAVDATTLSELKKASERLRMSPRIAAFESHSR